LRSPLQEKATGTIIAGDRFQVNSGEAEAGGAEEGVLMQNRQ